MRANQEDQHYPAAMVNITNKCTLKCRHCFIYREGNPNRRTGEMNTEKMVDELGALQKKHGIGTMLWMGGEPLLRPDVLLGATPFFANNTVTTNGTLDLIDLPLCTYVISLDGPQEENDAIRGEGCFDKVMDTLSRVPDDFKPTVMAQCVVTKRNEMMLEQLLETLLPTRIEGMTFSFYVPPVQDNSDLTWKTLTRRDRAVKEVMRLKKAYPEFVWNSGRGLELTLSDNAKAVTNNCPPKKYVLLLYLDGDKFVQPFCCYGNDVNCDLCGAWVVFSIAVKLEQGNINSFLM